MKGVDADYAYIKKAICYGFVAKTIKKLKSWIPLYNCIQNPITVTMPCTNWQTRMLRAENRIWLWKHLIV
jgi:hypothetical protein